MHCQRKAVEAGKIGAADNVLDLSQERITYAEIALRRPAFPGAPRGRLLRKLGSGPVQCDEAGETLPVPLLHFALPLDDMEAARAFLRDHGKDVACYRPDPRGEGKLMLGMHPTEH
jgi:hypothetical protein